MIKPNTNFGVTINIMRIIIATIFAITILVSQVSTALAGKGGYDRDVTDLLITTATSLNVRAGPYIGAKIIGKVAKGTLIHKFEADGDWLVVSHQGGHGWVSKEHTESLRRDPEQIIRLNESFALEYRKGAVICTINIEDNGRKFKLWNNRTFFYSHLESEDHVFEVPAWAVIASYTRVNQALPEDMALEQFLENMSSCQHIAGLANQNNAVIVSGEELRLEYLGHQRLSSAPKFLPHCALMSDGVDGYAIYDGDILTYASSRPAVKGLIPVSITATGDIGGELMRFQYIGYINSRSGGLKEIDIPNFVYKRNGRNGVISGVDQWSLSAVTVSGKPLLALEMTITGRDMSYLRSCLVKVGKQ